jgi:endonuclease I
MAESLAAQPATYFASAYGLSGTTLKSQLTGIIDGHTTIAYTSGSPNVWDAHKDIYEDPNNSSNIILFYSGDSIDKALQDSGGSPANYRNREHLWPNSYGIDGATSRGYTDLFHLVPAYKGVNSSRGNKYFDNVSPGDAGYTSPAHYLAPLCEANTDAWEPADAQKGWAARAMLYMDTRYSTLVLVDTPPSAAPDSSSSRMAQLSVMLEWNRKFLPGAKELYVNQRIYDDYQNNRNPYIDYPEFADAVWVSGPSWGGWRLAHFNLTELLDPAISGDLADPDGDTIVNLVEMARYSNPRVADGAAITESGSGNQIRGLHRPFAVGSASAGRGRDHAGQRQPGVGFRHPHPDHRQSGILPDPGGATLG